VKPIVLINTLHTLLKKKAECVEVLETVTFSLLRTFLKIDLHKLQFTKPNQTQQTNN